MIEAGEHIGLVHYVIDKIGVPVHLRDEAFSEGLVLLAVASAAYDSSYGVPEGAYLAPRIRWGLKNWMINEFKHISDELIDDVPTSHEDHLEARRTLDRIIYVAARRLNLPEYVALLGAVYGAKQSELSSILGKNGKQLEALRLSARAKLKHELRLI